MRLMKIGFVVLASGCLWGCASQLTVTSGGQTSAGHCNHIEKTWGSLYGIDWCNKEDGVDSKEPDKPMNRVTAYVKPCDFLLSFITIWAIIPISIEYDMETSPLPKRMEG